MVMTNERVGRHQTLGANQSGGGEFMVGERGCALWVVAAAPPCTLVADPKIWLWS